VARGTQVATVRPVEKRGDAKGDADSSRGKEAGGDDRKRRTTVRCSDGRSTKKEMYERLSMKLKSRAQRKGQGTWRRARHIEPPSNHLLSAMSLIKKKPNKKKKQTGRELLPDKRVVRRTAARRRREERRVSWQVTDGT